MGKRTDHPTTSANGSKRNNPDEDVFPSSKERKMRVRQHNQNLAELDDSDPERDSATISAPAPRRLHEQRQSIRPSRLETSDECRIENHEGVSMSPRSSFPASSAAINISRSRIFGTTSSLNGDGDSELSQTLSSDHSKLNATESSSNSDPDGPLHGGSPIAENPILSPAPTVARAWDLVKRPGPVAQSPTSQGTNNNTLGPPSETLGSFPSSVPQAPWTSVSPQRRSFPSTMPSFSRSSNPIGMMENFAFDPSTIEISTHTEPRPPRPPSPLNRPRAYDPIFTWTPSPSSPSPLGQFICNFCTRPLQINHTSTPALLLPRKFSLANHPMAREHIAHCLEMGLARLPILKVWDAGHDLGSGGRALVKGVRLKSMVMKAPGTGAGADGKSEGSYGYVEKNSTTEAAPTSSQDKELVAQPDTQEEEKGGPTDEATTTPAKRSRPESSESTWDTKSVGKKRSLWVEEVEEVNLQGGDEAVEEEEEVQEGEVKTRHGGVRKLAAALTKRKYTKRKSVGQVQQVLAVSSSSKTLTPPTQRHPNFEIRVSGAVISLYVSPDAHLSFLARSTEIQPSSPQFPILNPRTTNSHFPSDQSRLFILQRPLEFSALINSRFLQR